MEASSDAHPAQGLASSDWFNQLAGLIIIR
jgi:hypothetical protein